MKRRGALPIAVVLGVVAAAVWALASRPSPRARLEIWYGLEQRIGHLGTPQPDFNLLGEADGHRLTCRVNGGLPRELEIGRGPFGFRRLGTEGHFNADIPLAELRDGTNEIVVVAEGGGTTATATVTVERVDGGSPPLPLRLRWSDLERPRDGGTVVDGLWRIEGDGLRSPQPLYDRLFLIGGPDWTDYEVRTTLTVHGVARETGPKSGAPGLGVILRFAGHVVDPPRFPDAQPKWGFQPFGAMLWLRWSNGGADAPPVPQYYRGDRNGSQDGAPLPRADRYGLRARCDTDPDDTRRTRYRLKLWPANADEPEAWSLDVTQDSETALRAGGFCLVAHHVDATFGDVEVRAAD